jgi:aquaporin Z
MNAMVTANSAGGAGSARSARRLVAMPAGREGVNAHSSLRRHWPEYLMEGGELGLFMLSACVFATALQHPASPGSHIVRGAVAQRVVMGVAMGATAIALIYSPWGRQSGAHFNPAVTLTFLRLGKVERWDALFYIASQFVGGVLGVGLAWVLLRGAPAHASVQYAVTAPGHAGTAIAFVAEAVISFVLMATVLMTSNTRALERYTPLFAGALVATCIAIEAPLSGMSMNPARTFASAFHAGYWKALWIYFTAPPLGMLVAAQLFLRVRRGAAPRCAKLHHANSKRCIFRCGYKQPAQ